MSDHPWTCEDCGEHLDDEQTLCDECSERRFASWCLHQDWIKMTDREREDAIRWELR